jgi:carbon-monoxide dehydrogenase large subunit
MGLTYDSGDFSGNMEKAVALIDWGGFSERRARSKAKGLLRGIGVANYVESPVGAVNERIEVRLTGDGDVSIVSGTQSTGQGHETVFAQVVAEQLGVPMERVKLVTGDTTKVETGGGTHSDRTMRLGGLLLQEACGKITAAARSLAAKALDGAEGALRFEDGSFSAPSTNRAISLAELARAQGAPLSAVATIAKRVPAHPTGCAVCEVEVDPETGAVRIVDYVSVDDVGQAINPMIVEGQVHGGVAMGVGEALSESFAVDRGTGQVASASFMDYAVTRAAMLPRLRIALVEDPTAVNPLRVKGGGECGVTPAAAAVVNALTDALADYGVEDIRMPATPLRVWEALHPAERNGGAHHDR